MTLEDLRVFAAVCTAGNLSTVAREWGCSQSAISQHVRRLERELETPLLERGTRGVHPTPAGRILWRTATDSLAVIAAGCRELGELRRGEVGSLRLATGGTTVRRFMAGAVRRFRSVHPQVVVDIRSGSSTERCLEVLRGDLADLAFVTMGPQVRGIEQRTVIEARWMLVVPAGHELCGRARVLPGELPPTGYVSLPERSTSQRQLIGALAERGVRPGSAATVEDWDVATLLVELGFGWTIVPSTHLDDVPSQQAFVGIELGELPTVGFGWATRRWDALGRLALEFAEIVSEEITAGTERRLLAPSGATGADLGGVSAR